MEGLPRKKAASLEWAAANGDIDAVREFLAAGEPPDGKRRRTALYRAVCNQEVEIARLLLEHGANPQWRDDFSRVNLLYFTHQPEMIKLLESFGVSWEPVLSMDTLVKKVAIEGIRAQDSHISEASLTWLEYLSQLGEEVWSYRIPLPHQKPKGLISEGYVILRDGCPIKAVASWRMTLKPREEE
jgi:hypothetical protein